MNIKPFDSVSFMREGVLMRCMAVKVEDDGVLVTYNINGRAKLKALTLSMIVSHEPQIVQSNHRRWWWLMILFVALLVLAGIQFTLVSTSKIYILNVIMCFFKLIML